MFITLSSTEVKAHRLKAFSGWSLRWKPVLITDGPLGYMKPPQLALVLPERRPLQLTCRMLADAEHPVRDGLQGIKLWVSGALDVDRPEEGIVTVEVSTAFDIAGNQVRVEHRQLGVLRIIGV